MKKGIVKQPIKGICGFLLYFIYAYSEAVPLALFHIDYSTMSLTSKTCYLIGYELLFLILLFFLFKEDIVPCVKDFFKNFKSYMKEYSKYWFCAFGLMIVSNLLIVTLFPNSVATNQQNINEIFVKAPIYMIISAALLAPIIEETVFRLSLYKIFQSDTIFIFLSGLIFGLLHVVGSFEQWIDLIYIIPYSIPGLIFAYTLVKSKNIMVPMSLHFMHNTFTMAVQVILTFFL